MATKKQTDTYKSLNSFNEGIVKIISASVSFNRSGRSVIVRTFLTVDGVQHTMTDEISSTDAYHAIELAFRVKQGARFDDDFS